MGVLQRWGGGMSRRKRAALMAQQEEEARRAAEEAARVQAEEAARKAAEEAAARQAAEQAAAQRAAEEAAARQAAERAAAEAAQRQAAEVAQRQAQEAARQAAMQQQMEAAKVPFAPQNAPEKPTRPTFFEPTQVTQPAQFPAIAPPPLPPPPPQAPVFQPLFNNPLAQDIMPYQPFQPVPTNFFTSMLGGGKPNFPQGTQPVGFFQNMVSNPVANVDPFAPQVFTNPMTTYTGPVAFQPVAPVTPIGTDIFALRPLGGLV